MGDLIQDLEGNLDLVQCWMSGQACPRLQDCKARSVWAELRRTIYDKLNTLTLNDLLHETAAGRLKQGKNPAALLFSGLVAILPL